MSLPRRRARTAAVLMVGGLTLLTACGLKPAAYDQIKAQSRAGGGVSGAGGAVGGAGTVADSGVPAAGAAAGGAAGTVGSVSGGAVGAGGAPAAGGSAGRGPGGSAGGSSGGSAGGPAGGPAGAPAAGRAACSAPTGGTTTGETNSTLRIGIHAPQTGTGAPLPPSFAAGSDLYWHNGLHKICGRTVVVDFQDDTYKPDVARQKCEAMAAQDFLVIGAAGTDQIQACATDPVLARANTPYLSAGVTTNGLTSVPNYFALSLTYQQQGALVLKNAQMQNFPAGKWAVVTGQSDNFADARQGMEAALRSAGIPFDDIQVNQTNDNGLQSRAAQTGVQLAQGRYGVVFVDMAPGYFVYMTGAASKQAYNPQYTGPGVTMTEVTVAQLVCSGTAGVIKANFLAPYPGIDRATPDFISAAGGKYDDIYWSLWGQSQLLEQILNSANVDLTRENVIATLGAGAMLPGGVFPPANFSRGHFGGTAAYSQTINCNKTEPNQSQPGAWDTLGNRLVL